MKQSFLYSWCKLQLGFRNRIFDFDAVIWAAFTPWTKKQRKPSVPSNLSKAYLRGLHSWAPQTLKLSPPCWEPTAVKGLLIQAEVANTFVRTCAVSWKNCIPHVQPNMTIHMLTAIFKQILHIPACQRSTSHPDVTKWEKDTVWKRYTQFAHADNVLMVVWSDSCQSQYVSAIDLTPWCHKMRKRHTVWKRYTQFAHADNV